MRFASVQKNSYHRQMEAISSCHLTLHNDHHNHLSDPPANAACKHNVRTYRVCAPDAEIGLTNVTYLRTDSFSHRMEFLRSFPDNHTCKTDNTDADYHLTNSHSEQNKNEGVARLATIVA